MTERLQKILARAGVASRRGAEKLMLEGRVTVDGVTAGPGFLADAKKSRIEVDGRPIGAPERKVYFILNKPKGCLSTASDERGRKTVLDLVPGAGVRLYPVGRLDAATEGLILLTNDGGLTNALIHPRGEIWRTYVATVEGDPSEEEIRRLRRGVELADGPTLPAKARRIARDAVRNRTKIELTIREGRNREVRRMFEAIGYNVRALKRTEFAGLTLSGLSRGAARPLTAAEVAYLYDIAGLRRR